MYDEDIYTQTKGGNGRPLWAPWRIEYIRKEKSSACFLCEAGGSKTSDHDSLILYRGSHAFLMLNAYPYNSGHALVAPYQHVSDLNCLNEEVQNETFQLILRLKSVIEHTMQPDGCNFGFNIGEAAGAGVAGHVHGHIVPRWFGDTNFMPVISDTRVVPEAIEATADLLRNGWAELFHEV